MINEYIEKNRDKFIKELFEILRIPSISADSNYTGSIASTAEYLSKHFRELGADNVQIMPTYGHPVVYAEKIIDDSLPTVLVYGHYDVQPPDPLELWDSDPFEPVIRKTDIHPQGAIFARGACDDKGQFFMHIKAFEAMLETNTLACNVKFIIEGEEEVGSENLEDFISENKEKLAADVILISDTGMISMDVPSITVGLRGLSYVEVEIIGPNRDLHSGLYGGAVSNPLNVFSKMFAQLFDEDNKITIPGFYDDVLELTDEERADMAEAPFSEDEYCRVLDIDATDGEVGYSTVERATIRPTLDINGIWGGYTGEGAKTVIGSKINAKISMRLVPNQNPDKITKMFVKYFTSLAPPGVKVKVIPHHGGDPALTPPGSTEYQAASLAIQDSFGKKPVPIRSGGSIPIVALFEKVLEIKTVLLGFGLDSDAIHSPNEHYGVENYFKGIETIPHFYKHYAELKKNQ
jgi:acetylornithine deacetylase/succinyl-diaminopimelate desuccinylase-like protein